MIFQLMLDDRETPEFENCSLACIAAEAAGNITKEALIDCINDCYRLVHNEKYRPVNGKG